MGVMEWHSKVGLGLRVLLASWLLSVAAPRWRAACSLAGGAGMPLPWATGMAQLRWSLALPVRMKAGLVAVAGLLLLLLLLLLCVPAAWLATGLQS
jgi:hypothetical protein